jgi:hypothetical protein
LFLDGVDVGAFVDYACLLAAEEGGEPFRRRLVTCY